MPTKLSGRLTLMGAAASLACAGLSGAAQAAQTLDPVSVQTDTGAPTIGTAYAPGGISSAGSANFNDNNYGIVAQGIGVDTGTATTNVGSATSAPSVFATVSVESNGASSPTATAIVFYEFEVLGHTGQTAGVDVTALGKAFATGGYDDGNAIATFQVYYQTNFQNHFLVNDQANVTCPDTVLTGSSICTTVSPDFALNNQLINVPENVEILVNVQAQAVGSQFPNTPYSNFGTNSPQFIETFTASVDPTFSLDPSDRSGLSLEFSSGIEQPAPGVPEPAAWALMVAGFGLMGGALRARRRTAAA